MKSSTVSSSLLRRRCYLLVLLQGRGLQVIAHTSTTAVAESPFVAAAQAALANLDIDHARTADADQEGSEDAELDDDDEDRLDGDREEIARLPSIRYTDTGGGSDESNYNNLLQQEDPSLTSSLSAGRATRAGSMTSDYKYQGQGLGQERASPYQSLDPDPVLEALARDVESFSRSAQELGRRAEAAIAAAMTAHAANKSFEAERLATAATFYARAAQLDLRRAEEAGRSLEERRAVLRQVNGITPPGYNNGNTGNPYGNGSPGIGSSVPSPGSNGNGDYQQHGYYDPGGNYYNFFDGQQSTADTTSSGNVLNNAAYNYGDIRSQEDDMGSQTVPAYWSPSQMWMQMLWFLFSCLCCFGSLYGCVWIALGGDFLFGGGGGYNRSRQTMSTARRDGVLDAPYYTHSRDPVWLSNMRAGWRRLTNFRGDPQYSGLYGTSSSPHPPRNSSMRTPAARGVEGGHGHYQVEQRRGPG
ncbi:unnamed protein product [Amoebophrya sp. A25]|nr:unnamed protein product [Amoebophrya sp. A25]|eukprot:GSA25T00003315001.1